MKKRNFGQIYTLPLLIWISIFFTIPLCIIILYSFLKKGIHGGVIFKFSLEGYLLIFNPMTLKVILFSLWIAFATTFFCIIIGIPTGYFIARSKYKDLLIIFIMIPFWTNFLIRIYAWIAILGNNGIINNFLLKLGLISNNIQLLYNQWAIILVMIYAYLPFAILPLFSTSEKFDLNLLEAARDLGATKFQAFVKIFIPSIKPGIVTAILFTFIPSFGNYAIPQIIGGKDSFMIGNIISNELTITRNWPYSSAISVVLMIVTMIGILLFVNFNKTNYEKIRTIKEKY